MIHKFHLQKFIPQKFVLIDANTFVSLPGSVANCLGVRPGSVTVHEAPVNYVMPHIGVLRVLNKLNHAINRLWIVPCI